MALNHPTISKAIADAFKEVMYETGVDEQGNPIPHAREDAIDKVADKLAQAVEDAIKSATIMYTSGLVAPTGGGPVTGTFEGKLE